MGYMGKGKGDGGQGKERMEGPCLDLILSKVPKKKRGHSKSTSPESPSKKAKSVEEEGFDAGGEHDSQRSIELTAPISPGSLRTRVQKSCVYRGKVGLALWSSLVSKDLEEKLKKTSTLDLYSGFANRIVMILARLLVALNRALRTEEQVLEQGCQLHQRDEEVEAFRVQLAMKQERLDEIRRAWEGLASTLIQGGKITAEKWIPFLAWPPIPFIKKRDLT
ncbi:hypothetical protein AXF42_Ash011353 [Apostasia shenzhenica]|uniref:Uncharacterized protein n=1 Tax=Apostasia shenzhenica TaxID=1088818 RepID=A0A2I0AEA9_9ASPA|nr:hypothetical protein AXF42_Ash011353 [Apostasia shenzhenica]